jgi:hypothetical protein
MPKGKELPVGTEKVYQNGYTYVKTRSGWRLKHYVIWEGKNHRAIDTTAERCFFKDGDRTNFDLENLEVRPMKYGINPATKLRDRVRRLEVLHTRLGEELASVKNEVLRQSDPELQS